MVQVHRRPSPTNTWRTPSRRCPCSARLRSRRRSAAGGRCTALPRACKHPNMRLWHCCRDGDRRFRCPARRRWRCRSGAAARCIARTSACKNRRRLRWHCCRGRGKRFRCSARHRWHCRSAAEARCIARCLAGRRRSCRHYIGTNTVTRNPAIGLRRYIPEVATTNTVSRPACKRRTGRWQRRGVFLSGRRSRCHPHTSRIGCPNRGGSAPDSPYPRCRCRARPPLHWKAHQELAHPQDCPRPAHPGR